MDFITFKEKLASEDLKTLNKTQKMLAFLDAKYAEKEIIGSFRINQTFAAIYFKQKLWEKLAFFKDGEWFETRVNSLTNKLPEDAQKALEKAIKKQFKIIKVESVILESGDFYFFVIVKIASKKKMIHVTKEGKILVNEKYIENQIRLEEDDDDDDDDDDATEDIDLGEEVGGFSD